MQNFDYFTAFQRNLGFLSQSEQELLRTSRVAIAGLGGTGGAQVHALARMGIGQFNLADPDSFELVNFNRQIGATMSSIGRRKTDVLAELVYEINPEANVQLFNSGIMQDNIDSFLTDVDIVVDSLDFYCFKERFLLYKKARELNLWVLTSPPLGFGFTLLVFDPHGMSFEEYFGFDTNTDNFELTVSLIAGISPKPWLMSYLYQGELNPNQHRLPSVGAAPFMIAGVIATEVVNIITHKKPTLSVPDVIQFDALLRRFHHTHYHWGMRSPLQRLKKILLRRQLRS